MLQSTDTVWLDRTSCISIGRYCLHYTYIKNWQIWSDVLFVHLALFALTKDFSPWDFMSDSNLVSWSSNVPVLEDSQPNSLSSLVRSGLLALNLNCIGENPACRSSATIFPGACWSAKNDTKTKYAGNTSSWYFLYKSRKLEVNTRLKPHGIWGIIPGTYYKDNAYCCHFLKLKITLQDVWF